MPPADPAPTSRRAPSRRGTLTLLLTAPLLGACGVRWVTGTEPTPEPDRSADDLAREAAVASTLDLSRLLSAAAGGAAPLATLAESAARTCAAHLLALGGTPDAPASTSPTDPSTSGTTSSEQDPLVLAQSVVDSLGSAASEVFADAASTDAASRDAASRDVSGPMARLLVSIAASRTLLAETIAAATGTVAGTPPELPTTPPTGTPSATPTAEQGSDASPGTVALQAALAGEHAAVFGYALVVGRVGDLRRAEAEADLAAHRVARDDLVDVLLARGADPEPAQPSYDAQAPTPDAAAALAATLEERLAATYADVVAASTEDRALGANSLVAAARDARRWGSTVTAFPGLPELGEDGSALPAVTATP